MDVAYREEDDLPDQEHLELKTYETFEIIQKWLDPRNTRIENLTDIYISGECNILPGRNCLSVLEFWGFHCRLHPAVTSTRVLQIGPLQGFVFVPWNVCQSSHPKDDSTKELNIFSNNN